MIRALTRGAALAIACLAAVADAAEPSKDAAEIEPFLRTHCLRCHDANAAKGNFRLDSLPREFGDATIAQRWSEVLFRVSVGEMPPDDEPQPTPGERGDAMGWISTRLKEGEAARMAKRGPVELYRLSRDEYAYTIRDLLGVHLDVKLPGAFNEDPRWHGFDRVGSLLTLSPSHVERYFRAAETALDLAFPESPVASRVGRKDANEGREQWLAERKIAGRVRWPFWPGRRMHVMNVQRSGTYRVKVQLSGLRTKEGASPHLTLWHQQLKTAAYDLDALAPEESPAVIEFEVALSPGGYELVNEAPGAFNETGNHTLNVLNMGGGVFTSSRDVRDLNPTGYKLFDDDGGAIYPMLIVDWIEWEGPLVSDDDRRRREDFVPRSSEDLAEARACLARFAERAWRRPPTDAEIDRYVAVVQNELAAGEKFPAAYRAAMTGVLASKNFYYLAEGSPDERRDRLDDWELASRLSYFLWSSAPDDELYSLAREGRLHDPAVLRAQLARMSADPKIARFFDSFPRQWLQLHRVGMFPPDPQSYPDYDRWLERSMVLETTGYFETMFRENRPIREFLSSDWTVVNPRLAAHYGLPAPERSGFQKATLRPEDHRGGLLTQGAILSLTSDGSRHRPVHRGVWVSEAVFARTPPPPPPNVEPLEPTPKDQPKATVRAQLATHATHAVCASCHAKIDPLGFAFDNYDAIGRWRTAEKTSAGRGEDPPVDASGLLPDGRAFDGPDAFKRLLVDDVDRFARAFVEQLATYALRRVPTVDDAPRIQAIAEASRGDEYRLRTLLENFVTSELFLKR